MGKLIYVDRLKKDILALQDCYNGFSDTYDKACIIGVIDAQPTIEERKRGEWIDGSDERFVKCSICGMETTRNELRGIALFGKEEPNFCPNCGADMRGGQNG